MLIDFSISPYYFLLSISLPGLITRNCNLQYIMNKINLALLLGAFKFRYLVFAVNFFVLLLLSFVFFLVDFSMKNLVSAVMRHGIM